jgi:hypothetical protein
VIVKGNRVANKCHFKIVERLAELGKSQHDKNGSACEIHTSPKVSYAERGRTQLQPSSIP